MRWASVALPGVVLCALPCTCSMTGFQSMNTCVAAHAINGFGSDIMLILPNNDAYCDLCDLISATCKIRCSCIESHAMKTCCLLAVCSFMYQKCCILACCPGRYRKCCILVCCSCMSEMLCTGFLFVHVPEALYTYYGTNCRLKLLKRASCGHAEGYLKRKIWW